MRLVVGLGNPGLQYAQTRHNIGWLVLDELARRAGESWRRDGQAEVAELRLGPLPGEKVLLVKPQTFMNASGKAVVPLLGFYKLEPVQMLIVQDDLDSPFGLLRLRPGGRHGGQNGVRDIIRLLGHEQFPRLKIGISRPPPGRDPADWVLSKWAPDEKPALEELIRLSADAAQVWATQGLAEAQQQFNGTDLRPKPLQPEQPAQPAQMEAASVATDSRVAENALPGGRATAQTSS
ncbi:aminoacyl-tRNA hydrolase [Deinococcus sp.]|uniref:aminoacyl-tRNA hydrolase n=1 Tax=Deinococcus sp. TaxID=47478 RepID=UPI0025C7176B|nr:aminoacyl-tRNA hydrolase [Deinococcus sp.]